MLLESSGDYKMLLTESPGDGFYIECVITYGKGFIIAGENGQIMIYEKSEEPKNPYHRIATLVSYAHLFIELIIAFEQRQQAREGLSPVASRNHVLKSSSASVVKYRRCARFYD